MTDQDSFSEFDFVCQVYMKCVLQCYHGNYSLSEFSKRQSLEFRQRADVFFCLLRKIGVRIFPFLTFCKVIFLCTGHSELTTQNLPAEICRPTLPSDTTRSLKLRFERYKVK